MSISQCDVGARRAALVPEAGLEPARVSPGDFESPASTNSTTPALSHGGSRKLWHSDSMAQTTVEYASIEDAIGKTPLVKLRRIGGSAIAERGNVILAKLEGNNPAGSVKDRPALSMIKRAEERGEIKPGDTLIEATSGNTGI